MELIFENTYGKLLFRGKRSSNNSAVGLYIKKITGLGFPQREENIRQYAGEPGQRFLSQRELARNIHISADICCSDGIRSGFKKITEILYAPGVLTIHAGSMHRSIACRCCGIEEGDRHGETIMSFVVQFVCDNPFFTGTEQQEETLFSRQDLISGQFTLPCIFTERISQKVAVNKGNVRTEPIFILYHSGQEPLQVAEEEPDSIIIRNHQTGQKIELLYTLHPGEEVTIDIPDRRILSNLSGDITAYLSLDSYMSNFWLEPGGNLLEGSSKNGWSSTDILLLFNHRYLEAVI